MSLKEAAGTVPTSSNILLEESWGCVGKEFSAVRKVLLSYTVKD